MADFRRKVAELENEMRFKDREYGTALDESRRCLKKSEEDRRQLEMIIDEAKANIAEFNLTLGAAEGKVNVLESQLEHVETTKHDLELKLSSIVSSLRRSIGFQQGMPRSTSVQRARSPSPRRSRPLGPRKGKSLLSFNYDFIIFCLQKIHDH